MKYRMYVDEVGNPGLTALHDHRHRYLSLTGVVIEYASVATAIAPEMEALKWRHFNSHPDDPLILHRKHLVNKWAPFQVLMEPGREAAFNADLLFHLNRWHYHVITVAIDKAALLDRAASRATNPYSDCLVALVERYIDLLESLDGQGDVMMEARGGNEDLRLKATFHELCLSGSGTVSAHQLALRLTTSQLKVKRKDGNVAGLQIADLLAHPSWRAMVCQREGISFGETFGTAIQGILNSSKYLRDQGGVIEGWGQVWLPN